MEIKGYAMYFRKKKRILPTARIVDAENGVIEFSVSKKVKKGIYELALEGNDGKQMVISKVEVI